jgi:hypothetical protein
VLGPARRRYSCRSKSRPSRVHIRTILNWGAYPDAEFTSFAEPVHLGIISQGIEPGGGSLAPQPEVKRRRNGELEAVANAGYAIRRGVEGHQHGAYQGCLTERPNSVGSVLVLCASADLEGKIA